MKVSELIALLQRVDPDLPVCVVYDTFCCVSDLEYDQVKTGRDQPWPDVPDGRPTLFIGALGGGVEFTGNDPVKDAWLIKYELKAVSDG